MSSVVKALGPKIVPWRAFKFKIDSIFTRVGDSAPTLGFIPGFIKASLQALRMLNPISGREYLVIAAASRACIRFSLN